MKPTFFKGVALGAAVSIFVLLAASALAGTGIGAVFNLGQTNTVNATSTLTGATANPELQVTNTGAGGGVTATAGGSSVGVTGNGTGGIGVLGTGTSGTGVVGTATTGTGLRGLSVGGRGVQGNNNGATRSVNGDQPGVFGTAFADDGGQFVSSNGTGVCAAAGVPCSNYPLGLGLYATSANGNAIYAKSSNAAPLVLDGPAFYPPMTVNSTVKVTSLNADRLDGFDSTYFQARCQQGALEGFARVDGLTTFPGTYVTLPPASGNFNCLGNAVLARRVSAGIYFVRFVGVGSILATGSVRSSDEDDFVSIDKRFDSLDGQLSFRVSVRDANGGTEDRNFVLLTF